MTLSGNINEVKKELEEKTRIIGSEAPIRMIDDMQKTAAKKTKIRWTEEDEIRWLIDTDAAQGYEEDFINVIEVIIDMINRKPNELKSILYKIQDEVRETMDEDDDDKYVPSFPVDFQYD